MLKQYTFCFLLFICKYKYCLCYNIPNKKKILKERQQRFQKNIEIYESIKECNVSEIDTCADLCPLCLGSKVLLCNYCRGTGFLTMGDAIIGTANQCTICMGKGEKECKRCMGSGFIAKWAK